MNVINVGNLECFRHALVELDVLCPEASAFRARFFALSRGCARDAHCLPQFPVVSSISVTVCPVIL